MKISKLIVAAAVALFAQGCGDTAPLPPSTADNMAANLKGQKIATAERAALMKKFNEAQAAFKEEQILAAQADVKELKAQVKQLRTKAFLAAKQGEEVQLKEAYAAHIIGLLESSIDKDHKEAMKPFLEDVSKAFRRQLGVAVDTDKSIAEAIAAFTAKLEELKKPKPADEPEKPTPGNEGADLPAALPVAAGSGVKKGPGSGH